MGSAFSVILALDRTAFLQALYPVVCFLYSGDPDPGTGGTLSGWSRACSLWQWRLEVTSLFLCREPQWSFVAVGSQSLA